ncbi:MAG TPA: HAMP domain-containing sensor histidine kinase, partial [Planctomycetota bacterium]|nr:HAMP domain-containing sensor histidine kinase [Planctomycetota bacterium]
VAGARALRLAARAAIAAGEDALALRACERLLDRWPDAAAEGEYPFGPGAAAAAAEVWRRRLAAGAPGSGAGFVEAILAWRRALVRAPLAASTAASEAADCRRAAEAAAPSLDPTDAIALREGLDALDLSDREADAIRPAAVRTAIRAAAAGAAPRWVEAAAPDGGRIVFCAAAGASGSVIAFLADAESVRAAVLRPLLAGFVLHEGVAVRALAPDGTPLDGGPEPERGRIVLASLPIALPAGTVVAEAILSDPSLLDREAARARNLVLGLFAAAALALGLGSLLVMRMVRSEVRLARMKADFVSGVSHDLKTPLTSIRMFVETLREGRAPTEEARKECLDVVDREARRLERLVYRVLEFSRLAAGTRTIRREPCDPSGVAREAAQVFRGRLGDEPCEFLLEAPDGLPEASLDRDAATQAILDLLENARKYTPAGGRRILLRAAALPGGGARFEVEDNGPGIPPVERERVFEEFYRLPGSDAAEGAGLGLSLVKRLAEAHGGSARVEDAPGGGSRFRVDLPGDPAIGGKA